MELEEIFNEYIYKSEQIILAKRAMKEIAENEIQRLILKKSKAVKESSNSNYSIDFFFIQDAKSGHVFKYNHVKSTIENRIKDIYLQKNKQYQWILSESYEIFKDFLVKIYAYLGFINKNNWPLKDYGNIVMSELYQKDFNYFWEQAKLKKDIPDSILSRIRFLFPEYKKIESNNKLEKNLLLEISTIEHFRHIIVHCGGKTIDKIKIIELILKKSGLWNNGNYSKEYYDNISSYFGINELNNTLNLLEIDGDFPGKFYDVLGDLMNSLNSVVYSIFNEINDLKKE